jgi:hypothetical protein
MAVSRVQTSSVLQGFPKYRSMLGGNAAFNPSSYESIATATGTGSSGTITFSSIPSTYTSLQIRYRAIGTTNGNSILGRFNSDTGSNYARHWLWGEGSVAAEGEANATQMRFGTNGGIDTTQPTVGIIDIHDYASTTKNKTVRSFEGLDENSVGWVNLNSHLYRSTSAITSLTIYLSGGNYTTSTVFSLYGIKGA